METKEKQLLWGIGAIVLLLVLIFVFSKDRDSGLPMDSSPEAGETADEARLTDQSPEETLAAFPPGFPVEEGVAEADGYQYIPANSLENQSTLSYTSRRSFSENSLRFREFLEANGYEIANETAEAGFVFYYATKDNNDISVTVEEREGKVLVTASYLKR